MRKPQIPPYKGWLQPEAEIQVLTESPNSHRNEWKEEVSGDSNQTKEIRNSNAQANSCLCLPPPVLRPVLLILCSLRSVSQWEVCLRSPGKKPSAPSTPPLYLFFRSFLVTPTCGEAHKTTALITWVHHLPISWHIAEWGSFSIHQRKKKPPTYHNPKLSLMQPLSEQKKLKVGFGPFQSSKESTSAFLWSWEWLRLPRQQLGNCPNPSISKFQSPAFHFQILAGLSAQSPLEVSWPKRQKTAVVSLLHLNLSHWTFRLPETGLQGSVDDFCPFLLLY